MKLTDKIWQGLDGGYRVTYDASIALKQLEQTTDPATIKTLLDELWNELHHQGDVGLASYLSVPQLARLAKTKRLFDWSLLGLCSVIEQQRHLGTNPDLPSEFHDYYHKGLADLKQFVIDNIHKDLDDTTFNIALSTLATCSGQIKLGKAISELVDNDTMDEFLTQF